MLCWMMALIGPIGWQEILIVLVVVLILFGGRKLPELARGLARSLKEFKNEMSGVKKDIEESIEPDEQPPPPPTTPKDEKPEGTDRPENS